MPYSLEEINEAVRSDPKGFAERSNAEFQKKVLLAAEKIAANRSESRIILLSGPSGSGKTTTAMSLIPFVAAALAQHENARANRIVSSAFKLIALLAIPAGVGLSVLSGPILLLLYPAAVQDAVACAPLLRVQGVACIFICLMSPPSCCSLDAPSSWGCPAACCTTCCALSGCGKSA